jgi:hypothetical protein
LIADDERAAEPASHPVRRDNVCGNRIDAGGVHRQRIAAVEPQPLDRCSRAGARDGGDEEGVLIGQVGRAFVRVDVGELGQHWLIARDRPERGIEGGKCFPAGPHGDSHVVDRTGSSLRCAAKVVRPRRSAMTSATRSALAIIVSVGFTAVLETKKLESAT